MDKATCPQAILEYLTEKDISIEFSSDATLLVKSQKNEIELAGMKEAHIKDAVAFCNFWYWFEQNNSEQRLSEYEVATNLSKFRAQQNDYLCDPFLQLLALMTMVQLYITGQEKMKIIKLSKMVFY